MEHRHWIILRPTYNQRRVKIYWPLNILQVWYRYCPDRQRWGQQHREIVCPMKQRWLRCRQQKQSLLSAKNRRRLFTFVLRTCEDDGTFSFRRWEKMKIMHFEVIHSIHTEFKKCWILVCRRLHLFLFTSITDEMSIFRNLLLLLFSVQWVIAETLTSLPQAKKLLTVWTCP